MHALVVFESMFGNTKRIAEVVARGLSERADTDLAEVGGAPAQLPEDVDLFVVGGPTPVPAGGGQADWAGCWRSCGWWLSPGSARPVIAWPGRRRPRRGWGVRFGVPVWP